MRYVQARERRKVGTVTSTRGRNSHSYSSRVAQTPFKEYHLQQRVTLSQTECVRLAMRAWRPGFILLEPAFKALVGGQCFNLIVEVG